MTTDESTGPASAGELAAEELMPLVSVVIVNWNGGHHLEHCLPSLRQLDFPSDRLEVLLVDNHSSDDSIARAQALYPGLRVIANARNEGFAKPNNDAAALARGRYLALLNNDMRVDRGWLQSALDALDPERGVVCVASKILDWDGRAIDFVGGTLHYLGYADQAHLGRAADRVEAGARELLFACGGAMLIDRAVFLELGGFDPDYFAIFEDVDLGWRLWLAGYRVVLAPDSRVFHRRHGSFAESDPRINTIVHRNALFTIFKNYEQQQFDRILPLAFVLAIRRAVIFSGLDKKAYRLWESAERRAASPEQRPEVLQQCQIALNHLVALDELLDHLPALLDKRRRVQALRRRSDQEILPRFGDPFRKIMNGWGYDSAELPWLEALGLERLFGAELGEQQRRLLAEHALYRRGLRERIAELERHVFDLELTIQHLRRHLGNRGVPPEWLERGFPRGLLGRGPRHYARRFIDLARQGQLGEALRRAWRKLSSSQ